MVLDNVLEEPGFGLGELLDLALGRPDCFQLKVPVPDDLPRTEIIYLKSRGDIAVDGGDFSQKPALRYSHETANTEILNGIPLRRQDNYFYELLLNHDGFDFVSVYVHSSQPVQFRVPQTIGRRHVLKSLPEEDYWNRVQRTRPDYSFVHCYCNGNREVADQIRNGR